MHSPESTGNDDYDLDLYSKPSGKEVTKVRLKGSLSVSVHSVDVANYMDI